MHPKYKAIIAESGLHKATILWSDCCEDDKVYMVTDEEMKAYMRDGSWNFKEGTAWIMRYKKWKNI